MEACILQVSTRIARWNPTAPATNQYATAINWPYAQAQVSAGLYKDIPEEYLTFRIPVYKKEEKGSSEITVSSTSSDNVSSIVEESSAMVDSISSQDSSENASGNLTFDYSATPPLEEEDFTLYNDSGEKIWWLNQAFKVRESPEENTSAANPIPGTRYIGRRELRKITPEDIFFYDVYKFESDTTTIFAFNYVGADLRDMLNCFIHAVKTTDSNYITARGIKIGDSRKKIWDAYGIKKDFASEYITYKDSKNVFEIYFTMENEVVAEIGISFFPDELQYVEYPDTYE